MEQFKAPSPLSLTANPADNWCSWEQSFRRYIAASGDKDEQGKIDILLHTIGEDALEVFNTLRVRGDGDELTMEDVLQAFKDYCSPQRNVVFQRLQYWSHQRTAGTSVNTFITELRQKSKDCEFGISENDMLRDKLMLSITDSDLEKTLLQERRLTLHRAIEICRATEQEKTLLQAIKTQHGVQEVPVDGEMKMILPDKSLHHNTSRQLASQSVPNTDETEKLVLAAFMPKVQMHRLQLQQPSVTDCVFSEKKNVEQLLPERLHIKEEPEMLSEGQEEKQLCVPQETNSAACPVKCEDEEEKPQASQLHWRQLTEMNLKEEHSTCSLNELMKRESVEINNKGPEAAQNLDPSSLVPQGPDGTETDSSQTEDSKEDDEDDDDDCWQKPLSESETSLFQQMCSKKKVLVKMRNDCEGGKKESLGAASKLNIPTGEKPFECDVCRKSFTRKDNLHSHMRRHTGVKPFKCDVCNKCFTQKGSLPVHMRLHTGEKPFKCDVCSKCFTYKVALQQHMGIHTGEKPFKCDVCSKCFTYKVALKRHMGIHTGENPFKCDVCSKCYTYEVTLKQHMIIHTGEKHYECDVCRKSFNYKVALQRHIIIHTGEKPFKCDVCRKCFNCKVNLKRHMRIHTGAKPFKCDVCRKCFNCKVNLKRHMGIHTREKPLKCDVCSKGFTRKAYLQSHMRMHK